jgi:hypothetical protein
VLDCVPTAERELGGSVFVLRGFDVQRAGKRVDPGADGEAGMRLGGGVDDVKLVVGQVELDVNRLAGLGNRIWISDYPQEQL